MSHISSSCMERSAEGGEVATGEGDRKKEKMVEGVVCLQKKVKG